MSRILAIDYGSKRSGLAITDVLQLIASGLTTVPTARLIDFLIDLFEKEVISIVVIGYPKGLDDREAAIEVQIGGFIAHLQRIYPQLTIARQDERFTSKMAVRAMIDGGMKKKKRQNKALVDQVSATLILQAYLETL